MIIMAIMIIIISVNYLPTFIIRMTGRITKLSTPLHLIAEN